jgi:hypothetical protein
MIVLYHGSGTGAFEVIGDPMPTDEWEALRSSACRLLRARKDGPAADLLAASPLRLFDGTNAFGDEFCLLYLLGTLEQYVTYGEQFENPELRSAYARIARVLTEIGPYIRFIAVELNTKLGAAHVATPTLRTTSDAVERALADAEQLIHTTGASSGVDRVHTAFHGHLLALCGQFPGALPADAGVTQLLKFLRRHHPAFAASGPRAGDIERVLNSLATIVDALNPLRNQASGAHPNPSVLEEPEAMLVINAVRSLLAYLDQKAQ